ncbi:TPA: AAA family ATPase, partial [Pyrococcus horikoshii]|nr:AAA family ATPase [Pyrococcus horikoshii]
AAVCREAALNALRRVVKSVPKEKLEEESEEFLNKLVVTRKDFEEALKKVKPSVSKYMMEYYRQFEEARKRVSGESVGREPDYFTG